MPAAIATEASNVALICESDIPLGQIPANCAFAMAIITGVEGASYRPVGAVMIVEETGRSWGSLSSGCLEQDVILHARAAIASDISCDLRYGRGSPFGDIQLPCGGGLDIRILPNPNRQVLERAAAVLAQRQTARIVLGQNGCIASDGGGMALVIRPQIRFVVFGKGPEAACCALLAKGAGYPVELLSPDLETLAKAGFGRQLSSVLWPENLSLDSRTAVLLFFHEHDHEPALLEVALNSRAFFVGAQGSLRSHQARRGTLAARGVAQARIDRLASPFGLIPSTRDAPTLAVSVMAHVLDRARSL